MNARWISLAIKDKRFCPACGRPVAKIHWKACLKRGMCFDCFFATHWSDGLGAGGSSRWDNRDNELDREFKN